MPSGEVRLININCLATYGMVGNSEHENISLGKAGRTRWLGKRSYVRGVAMILLIIPWVVVKVKLQAVDILSLHGSEV